MTFFQLKSKPPLILDIYMAIEAMLKILITAKKVSLDAIKLIRFGWIDSEDWIGQKVATGQQSRLSSDVENYKLLQLYRKI